MIKKYSLKLLEKAINQALKLDEATLAARQKLQNKVLKIVINPLKVDFFIEFVGGNLILTEKHLGAPDTTIESNPLGLIRLSLLPSSKVRSLFNDQVKISGDIELGQKVKQLFDDLDIDWEGHVAQFTGDVVAFQLGSFVRRGLAIKHDIDHAMRLNMTEYLQEETRMFPTREEVNDFFNDVDELSLDVERLLAQMKANPYEIA